MVREHLDFGLDLIGRSLGVHFGQNLGGSFSLTNLLEMTRRLREEELDDDSLKERWESADCDDPSPSTADVDEACTDSCGDDLSTCDGDNVQGDKLSADIYR